MKTVRQILDEKGHEIFDIEPDALVYAALGEMAYRNVGALLVRDGEEIVGIISERDYARKVILKDKASKNTPVKEIMSPAVICVGPDQKIGGCMALMSDRRVRHLAVVEEGRPVGVISIGDVVKGIIDQQQATIEQLEHYITGGR
jgi:CBS domain-containing protein